jgi:predicted dehydrogenase
MNRRYFFGTAVAGLALARMKAVAANEKMNVGIIGVGGRGRSLLGACVKLPDVNVTHVCDADQASLERAHQVISKTGQGQPKTTNDMRHLFDDKSVDAVIIATPDHWHAPATILACEAGKHVYVEKPASRNLA